MSDEELIAHCRTRIAGYKAPKRILRVEEFVRSPNGKWLSAFEVGVSGVRVRG